MRERGARVEAERLSQTTRRNEPVNPVAEPWPEDPSWQAEADEAWPAEADEAWQAEADEAWPPTVDEAWQAEADEDDLFAAQLEFDAWSPAQKATWHQEAAFIYEGSVRGGILAEQMQHGHQEAAATWDPHQNYEGSVRGGILAEQMQHAARGGILASGSHSLPWKIDKAMSSGRLNI